jgi:hypothetical protein
MYEAVECLANPSAIFDGIDSDDLRVLVAERRLFVTWKSFRNPMTAHREVYRLLPDKQFTEGLKLRHFLQMSRLDATRNTMGFDTGGRRRKNRKATLRLG